MKRLGVAIMVYNIDFAAGMERQALLLAERLAARGARITIVSSFNVPPGVFRLPPHPKVHERRGSIEIIRVPFFNIGPYEASEQLFRVVAAHVLLRRRRKIDAIYAVLYTCGCHAARVARVLPRPTCLKFAGGGIQGDLAEIKRQPALEETLADLRRIDHLACLSAQIAGEARASGLALERIHRIPNGVDLGRFPRRDSPGEPPAPRRIVFVGRLNPGKSVDTILEAFATLAPRFPDVLLDIVGEGQSARLLEALVRKLGLGARVSFLGRRPDVPDLLRRSCVFLLPSISEGMSNALLEALAAGVPVVATDIPGTSEIVRHEREALLVPVGDVRALAAAIERLLADPELARRLAAAGRARVEDEYDIERVADRYFALFRSAAKVPRALPSYTALLELHAHLARILSGFVARTALTQLRRLVTAAVVLSKRGFRACRRTPPRAS